MSYHPCSLKRADSYANARQTDLIEPINPSKDIAPIRSARFSASSNRCTAFIANERMNCVPLINAKPSLGPSDNGFKPVLL
jgi:hypothetical protein